VEPLELGEIVKNCYKMNAIKIGSDEQLNPVERKKPKRQAESRSSSQNDVIPKKEIVGSLKGVQLTRPRFSQADLDHTSDTPVQKRKIPKQRGTKTQDQTWLPEQETLVSQTNDDVLENKLRYQHYWLKVKSRIKENHHNPPPIYFFTQDTQQLPLPKVEAKKPEDFL